MDECFIIINQWRVRYFLRQHLLILIIVLQALHLLLMYLLILKSEIVDAINSILDTKLQRMAACLEATMSSKIDELENKFQKVMEGEVSKLKEEFNKNHPQNWSNKRNIYILITVNSTIAEEEKTMSEVKEWLETFSIPGIECL